MAHGSLPSGDYTSIGWRSVHSCEPDETNRSVDIPRAVARAQMKASLSGETRLVIVGATGMVGGYALRYALGHSAVKCVTAIVRRKLGISHPKLNEVIHQDFIQLGMRDTELSANDRRHAFHRRMSQSVAKSVSTNHSRRTNNDE